MRDCWIPVKKKKNKTKDAREARCSCEGMGDLPDKYPLMSLSSVLNCCRYLSLEAWGMAQSLVAIFGELLVNDVVEDEFELQKTNERNG